jgi:hypothetical protein
VKEHHEPLQDDPEELIDLLVRDRYTTRNGNERIRRGTVRTQVGDSTYRVEFEDGKQQTYENEELIAIVNRDDEEDVECWTFDKILKHRDSPTKGRKGIEILVTWVGYEVPTWEPMEGIKKDDPVTLAKYAEEHDLLEKTAWKWAARYVKRKTRFVRMFRQMMKRKRKAQNVKYQFGIRVPRTLREAYELDKLNGDTKWTDSIETEVQLLYDTYECFRLVETGEKIPEEYHQIPLIWVKFDGRRRARCVAGGHVTPNLTDDLYAGVANLETVRIAFLAAELFDLDIIAADVSSAYIQAFTSEKVFVKAGPKFGKNEGRYMIVVEFLMDLSRLERFGIASLPRIYAKWDSDLPRPIMTYGCANAKIIGNMWQS